MATRTMQLRQEAVVNRQGTKIVLEGLRNGWDELKSYFVTVGRGIRLGVSEDVLFNWGQVKRQ